MQNQEINVPSDVQCFFEELNDAKINYCHWKSNEHLYEGLVGKTDLDILVSEDDYDRFIMILRKNRFCGVVSMKWQIYPYVEDWIGMDRKTGIQVHIHLHRKLITGKTYVKEQYLPMDELVLKTKVLSEYGVYICNPNVEIIILIFRTLLKRPDYNIIFNNDKEFKFGKSIKRELDYLYKKIDKIELTSYLNELFDDDLVKLILSIIYDSTTNKKMKLLKRKIVAKYRSDRRKSNVITFIQNIYRYYLVKVMYRLKKPINLKKKIKSGGVSIAFLGVDGSGKSTISEIVKKWMNWKIDCRYVYMGTGDQNKNILNKFLRKISSKKSSSKSSESLNVKPSNSTKIKSKNGLKLFVINYNSYRNAKIKLKNVKQMIKLQNSGCVVIMDRYPQVQYVGINDGPVITEIGTGFFKGINKILQDNEKKIFLNISKYSPMLVIKLKISFEASRSRKQDSPEETIRKKIEIIDNLKFDNSKEIIINNECNIEDTIIRVKNEIWNYIIEMQGGNHE